MLNQKQKSQGFDMEQNSSTHLLLIEHDLEFAKELIEQLTSANIEKLHISHVSNIDDAFRELKSSIKNIIVIDIDNLNTLKLKDLHKHYEEIPIIVLTSTVNATTESEIMEKGVQDYLLKEHLTPHHLKHAINNTLERNKLALALKIEQKNMSKLLVAIQNGEIKKFLGLKDSKEIKDLLKKKELDQDTKILLLKAKQQKQAEALLSDLQ